MQATIINKILNLCSKWCNTANNASKYTIPKLLWGLFLSRAILSFWWKVNEFVAFEKGVQMCIIIALVIFIFKLKYLMKYQKKWLNLWRKCISLFITFCRENSMKISWLWHQNVGLDELFLMVCLLISVPRRIKMDQSGILRAPVLSKSYPGISNIRYLAIV